MKELAEARRQIENPSGFEEDNTRPEGASAEKDAVGKKLLEKLGWVKKRRNIELARSEYQLGEDAFEEAKLLEGDERVEAFRKAAQKYKSAAKNWQSSALEQDALVMAGDSYFFAEDFSKATDMYAKLIKEYPRTPYLDHVDKRRFEIADYWLKYDSASHRPFYMVNFTERRLPLNDTSGHGKRIIEKIRLDNPTGTVSDDATMRLACYQFEKGKWESAADTFADLRMTYPDSQHQFQAQFLELQSLLNSYEGPEYSGLPLSDAEKRVKQIVKLFPKEASEKQEEINLAWAKIRYLKAEREWEEAEFRRLREEFRAARFYYNRIIEQYSDTPFAKTAEEYLEKYKDRPDVPPQRLEFLAKMFPRPKREKPWFESNPSK